MARFFRKTSLLLLAALLAAAPGAWAAPRKKPSPTPAATPVPPPLAPGELPLLADGAIVIDGFTGDTLYEKNADLPQFPASTTKIMTALMIIEAGELERPVDIMDEDSRIGESGLDVKAGQQFSRRQMLFGLMLKSANDVAHALGRDNAGTMENFAVKMTVRAKELGATRTSFRNPHGLHHVEHITTPRDLAIIGRAAMQQPFFRQIVSTRLYDWPGATGPRPLDNHNKLLHLFPGCTGVKTGFTNPAQHTLVTAALRGGREVISVVMHDTRQGKWDDSMLLLSYGLEHAENKKSSTGN